MSHLHITTITFNCGREFVKPSIFARHLLSAIPISKPPDLLILCLQEIAPLSYSFLGGSYLLPYYKNLRHAVRLTAASLDDVTYINVIVRNVGMTAIMAFALQGQVGRIKWIETAGVGVGMREMGNKGAVGLRIGYSVGMVGGGETNENEEEEDKDEEKDIMEISVVGAHLAPMEDGVDRRNEDWKSIVHRLVFTSEGSNTQSKSRPIKETQLGNEDDENAPLLLPPGTSFTPPSSVPLSTAPPISSGIFKSTSHLIFAGDLNYRTSDLKPTLTDFLSFPQPTATDTSHQHPNHYSNLLKNDQLSREIKARRTCHGLREAPIDFPPTYKYSDQQRALVAQEFENSNNKNKKDSDDAEDTDAEEERETEEDKYQQEQLRNWDWAPHRWPSWCDRILYLDIPPWMKLPSLSSSSPPPPPSPSQQQIQIQKYTSLPLMSTSDHQPVLLSLSIPLKAIPPPPHITSPIEAEAEVEEDDIRLHPPFPLDPEWKEKRARARKWELAIGIMMYLVATREGNLVLGVVGVVVFVGGVWGVVGWGR